MLFGEYVCLAIMSFPWAFKTLGMAGGILSTLGLGLFALYTSLTREFSPTLSSSDVTTR